MSKHHADISSANLGIRNSSINKCRLLRAKILNQTVHNITIYKNYCKVYNKIKRAAKKKYFTESFAQNVNNIKRTWQLLHEALNKKPMISKYVDTFLIGNIEVTNKKEIANCCILSSLILEQQLAMLYPSQPLLFQITSLIAAKLTSSCIPRMNMK